MKLVTVQSNHNKRPLKMRVAKEDIYTRASSIPTVRFEDQELTSFGGIVVFQKLFAKLSLKERLRRCCAHLSEKNLYHPAVIVQWLIVHLLLGFRKLRELEFYEDDPLIKRVLGLKVLPDVSTISRALMEFDDRAIEAHHELNREQVMDRVQREGLRRITVDFDGSVLSREGDLFFMESILCWLSINTVLILCICILLSSPHFAPAWPPWANGSSTSASKAWPTWNNSLAPGCLRAFFPNPRKAPTAAIASIACAAPSSPFSIKSSIRTAPAVKSSAKSRRSLASKAKGRWTKAPVRIAKPANDCPWIPCNGCASPSPPPLKRPLNSGTACESSSSTAPPPACLTARKTSALILNPEAKNPAAVSLS